MSDLLMTRLELNSRDFRKINERLRARLTPTNGIDGDGLDGHTAVQQSPAPLMSGGRDHPRQGAPVPEGKEPSPSPQRHHLGTQQCGAITSDSPIGTAFVYSSSPFAQNQLPAPPQELPTGLLSLFSEEGEESVGLQHNSGTSNSDSTTSAKWSGSTNGPSSSSRQPLSSSPWEWPDVSRGQQGRLSSSAARPTRQKNGKTEGEYLTPLEHRSTAVRHASGGYRAGKEGDNHTIFPTAYREEEMFSQAAGATGRAGGDDGVERRTSGGGLEHVKKRLWGSMFEAAGASINRRRVGNNGANGGEDGKEPHQMTRPGNKHDDDENSSCSDNTAAAVRDGVVERKNNIDHALRASRQSQFPPLPWLAKSGVARDEVREDDMREELGGITKRSYGSNDKDDQDYGGQEEFTSSGGGVAKQGDRYSEKAAR
ncbi:unnamed protein product, partial [Ectocarpus fasciculatus]